MHISAALAEKATHNGKTKSRQQCPARVLEIMQRSSAEMIEIGTLFVDVVVCILASRLIARDFLQEPCFGGLVTDKIIE